MNNSMLYFNTGTEDSLCVPARNLYLIDAGNDVVNLYFTPQGSNGSLISSVVLTVADGDSDAVAKNVGAAISGGFKSEVITIADDAAGVYCDPLISACAAITADITVAFS